MSLTFVIIRFITGGFDKKVKIWNWDGTVVFEIGGFRCDLLYSFLHLLPFIICCHSDVITGICYNPNTKTLWVAANSTQPQIFDSISGANMTEYVSGIDPTAESGSIQHLKVTSP
jgi:hypothetical protein